MLSKRCLSVCPVCSVCLSVLSVCLSVCDVGVLWQNGWMDQDETWHGGGGRPRLQQHCVKMGTQLPIHKGTHAPNFRPISVVAKQVDGLCNDPSVFQI